MLTRLEKLNHQGFKYLCCDQGGLSCLFSHMEKSVTHIPQVYNVRMCVFMFFCVCMWWSLCLSRHLIQCLHPLLQQILFLFFPSISDSSFPAHPVAVSFYRLPPSPQVAIMSDKILMSQLCALLHTDRKRVSVSEQENQHLPSAISTLIASLSRYAVEVSPCDIIALCLSHGGSDISTTDQIRFILTR